MIFRILLLLSLAFASVRADTVAVNHPALVAGLSPFNWEASGSSYIRAANSGAYFKVKFSGTTVGLAVDVAALSGAGIASKQYPRFKYRIDGGSYTTRQLLSSDTTITLGTGLSDTTHLLEVHLLSTDAYVARWTAVSSLKITGIVVGTGKTLEGSPKRTGRTALWLGDSITEGAWSLGEPNDFADYSNYTDGTASYAKVVSDWLGVEYGMCAFGGTSWDSTFNSDVPSLPNTYNLIKSSVSRTFGAPAYVFVNMGTNGGVASSSTVSTFLGNLRSACGAATRIYVIIPFNQTGVTNITSGVTTYQAANPSDLCYLIDLGSTGSSIASANSTDGVHLDPTGHTLIAAEITPELAGTAWEVPAENMPYGGWIPGTTVGVVGGIPDRSGSRIDVTQSPYNADNTGATNAATAINAAITAASAGDEIYLPAGTYLCTSALSLSDKTQITLSGAGRTSTIIEFTTDNQGTGIGLGRSTELGTAHTITAGVSRGSTTITIDDTTDFTVDRMARIYYTNELTTPIVSVMGYPTLQVQNVMVTSKTSTTLTFTPAIYADFSGTATVAPYQFTTLKCGVQNLTINANNKVQNVIYAERLAYGWVKNVRINNAKNVPMYVSETLGFEVRDSWFNETGSGLAPNGSGVRLHFATATLIENNIIKQAFPIIELNDGSLATAILFNYTYDSGGKGIDDGHAPHNRFTLIEGNVSTNVFQDGYYGGSSHATVYRNRLTGESTAGVADFAVVLERFSRGYVVAGNVLLTTSAGTAYSMGNPNLGNSSYEGTVNFNAGDPWTHFKLDGTTPFSGTITTRTSDTQATITLSGTGTVADLIYPNTDETNGNMRMVWSGGARVNVRVMSTAGSTVTMYESPQGNTSGSVMPLTSTAVTLWAGALGFQELDLAVAPSTTLIWNWNADDTGIPTAETPGSGQTFPDSIAYPSGAPSWWDRAWPAYSPASPSTRDDVRLPAHALYLGEGGGGTGTINVNTLNTTTLNAGSIIRAP